MIFFCCTFKTLLDLNIEFEKVLDFLNTSKDLANKRKIRALIELKNRVTNRVRENEEKTKRVKGNILNDTLKFFLFDFLIH